MEIIKGDILKSKTDAIVNPINCVGFMGKALAKKVKDKYPHNFKVYKEVCNENNLNIGEILTYPIPSKEKPDFIFNFPTKYHYKDDSKLEYIEKGLNQLRSEILYLNINSISIPALGCGLGNLNWNEVKNVIFKKLDDLKEINIYLYEPFK